MPLIPVKSKDEETMQSRRTFLRYWSSLPAIPLLNVLGTGTAWAAGEVKITEDDPVAAALGYKHDATAVDTSKFPKRAAPGGEEEFCDNCLQYKATEEGWGTCAIFPGKLVAAKGWCNVWVAIP